MIESVGMCLEEIYNVSYSTLHGAKGKRERASDECLIESIWPDIISQSPASLPMYGKHQFLSS